MSPNFRGAKAGLGLRPPSFSGIVYSISLVCLCLHQALLQQRHWWSGRCQRPGTTAPLATPAVPRAMLGGLGIFFLGRLRRVEALKRKAVRAMGAGRSSRPWTKKSFADHVWGTIQRDLVFCIPLSHNLRDTNHRGAKFHATSKYRAKDAVLKSE